MSRDEDVLRRILEAEAAKVEVSAAALHPIGARPARGPWRFSRGAAALTAATATAVVVGAFALIPRESATPDPQTASTPSWSSTFPGTSTANLAIYYVGDDQGRKRLYREFHHLPMRDTSTATKIGTAVTEMLRPESAHDPDYASAWPTGVRVTDVSVSGGTVTVNLSKAPPSTIARQELVWTVAAVVGGDPTVKLLVNGSQYANLRKAPAIDTLAALWLINPQHGETVAKDMGVHVAGAVFEATAHLKVRQGDVVIDEKVLTLSIGAPSRGEAKLTLTLAPGEYTLEAYTISAADGSVQHLDDHVVTVR
ncbi:GerMN domain-containing protein [Micromonospora sp. CPCC 205371]|nr:GerMN domain-containing protein [Micromonospora sp. CPCC 205371]